LAGNCLLFLAKFAQNYLYLATISSQARTLKTGFVPFLDSGPTSC